MKSVSITELKAQLSRYIDRVQRGQEILVTERGQVVARILPASPAPDENWIEALSRAGVLRPGRPGLRPKIARWIKDPHSRSLEILSEDRAP